MPTSSMGRWSGRLLLVSALFFGLFFAIVATGQRGGEAFFSNPALALPMLAAATAAVCAGCAGIAGIRRGDQSFTVVAAIVSGAVVILWTAAEIVFPH